MTLKERIEFQEIYGNDLDKRGNELLGIEDENERDMSTSEHFFESCCKLFAFTHKVELSAALKVSLKEIIEEVSPLVSPITRKPEGWYIEEFEVTPLSRFTFNEFLVSKEAGRQYEAMGKSVWSFLPVVCAVFLRKDEQERFEESFLMDNSDRMNEVLNLDIAEALWVNEWFNNFNQYILDSFSVFKKGRSKGINMEEVFKAWGWVSFLSMVAKEGVFTVQGSNKNAIDCAKEAKLYDVLVYTSEKKDSEDIINHYYEQLNKK